MSSPGENGRDERRLEVIRRLPTRCTELIGSFDNTTSQNKLLSTADLPGPEITPQPLSNRDRFLKRCFDVAGASFLIITLMPAFLILAIAIRLDTPGPILFRQERLGLAGKRFQILKFRSYQDGPKDGLPDRSIAAHELRISRLGHFIRRTSIDELPQLWNVLKGDMSLVGPRPHMPTSAIEGKLFCEAATNYRVRHCVKPGITGWAQVNGWCGPISTLDQLRKRIQHDVWYINHWNLALDLKILLKTVFIIHRERKYIP